MVSLQCWSPAQSGSTVVLRALPFLVVAIFNAQIALGLESSLSILSAGQASTLDARVSPQITEPHSTIVDVIGNGVLAEKKATKPSRTATTPTTKKSTTASPFQKWVRPQATSATKPEKAEAAAQVARRLRRPTRTTSKPPQNTKPDTAAISDISKRTVPKKSEQQSQQLQKVIEKQAEPKPSDYPAPQVDGNTNGPKTPELPPLTTSQRNLRKKIRSVLSHYYSRPLNTRDRSPWELMHAMLAFEAHSRVLQGGPQGEPITAVGWLCYNQACKRRTLMYVNDEGELRVRVGPALQGHRGQLLAMLAQSRINENYPMLVEGHELKIKDLIEMEQRTCYPRTELTFKLIGLMHYLDSDATWLNDQGMEWGIPRLIAEELRQPVRGAACGGTHRLGGLTLAYKTREARGEPVDGQYLKAKKFVTRYQQYAYRLQNRDGSFSTEWFRGPGNEDDIDRKLKTTGHILEWLLYAATEKELKHWRTTKAANYLANIMYRNRYRDWESGPLGHAIHALLVYDRLVFSPYDPPEHSTIATLTSPTRPKRRNR